MSVHDPIADMITIVRNGIRAGHAAVNVRRSRMTLSILDILKKERFIFGYKTVEDRFGSVRIYLENPKTQSTETMRRIRKIQRVSRPGLRIYSTSKDIPYVLNGLGICLISTSNGIMEGREAKKRRVGGEVLLKVW